MLTPEQKRMVEELERLVKLDARAELMERRWAGERVPELDTVPDLMNQICINSHERRAILRTAVPALLALVRELGEANRAMLTDLRKIEGLSSYEQPPELANGVLGRVRQVAQKYHPDQMRAALAARKEAKP